MKKLLQILMILLIANTFVLAQQSVVVSDATGATIDDWATTSFTQNVSVTGNPNLLSIVVDLDHTWVNDLEMRIINPDGDSATVFTRLGTAWCFGCGGIDMDITFTSTSSTTYSALNGSCGNNPAYNGDAQSYESLDALLTGTINGDWIVKIKDYWKYEEGTINTIALIFSCPNLEVNSQTLNISCFGACDGSIAVLSVNNAVLPLTYSWSTGQTTANMSNLCAGDYSVTITDAINCQVVQSYTLTQPSEITITIDSTRDVRLNPLGYIAITTNNNGNYIFDWHGPNNFLSFDEDIFDLGAYGCYTLTVTDTTTNCSIDSTVCLLDKTATIDLEFSNVNIYPNPTKGNFIIDFSNTKLNQTQITLYDLSGKQRLNLEKQASDKILNVKSESLNSGLYIIRIKSAKFGTSFRKVIISK